MNETRQITLMKCEHRYIFKYEVGEEMKLIDIFAEYASDPNRNFDWFDAVVLSYELERRRGSIIEAKLGK